MSEDSLNSLKRRFPLIMVAYFMLFFAMIFLQNKSEIFIYGAMGFSLIGILLLTGCVFHIYSYSRKGEKSFWILMLFAFLAYFLGELIRLYYFRAYHMRVPIESFVNFAYLINGTLIPIAVISLMIPKLSRTLDFRSLLDFSIITISILTTGWGFLIYPMVNQVNGSLLLILMSIWYPLTDIGIVIALLFLMMFSETFAFSVKWLTFGLLCFLGLDLLNMIDLTFDLSGFVGILDPFWYISFASIVYFGLNRKTKKTIVKDPIHDASYRLKENLFMVFPYLTLMVLIVVMVLDQGRPDAFILGSALCNFLIILKQLAVLSENRLKISQLTNLNRNIMNDIRCFETDGERLVNQYQVCFQDSMTDHLTGTFNRRYLDKYLNELKEPADQQTQILSVVMLDIDNFKDINDHWGHLAGDEVLKLLSAIMKEFVREPESVIRYGGDEFVIILPGIPAQTALIIAERIRRSVEKRGIPMIDKNGCCTISAGISEWNKSDMDLSMVINNADSALYVAKMNGRNKCEVYTPEMTIECS